MPWNTAGTITLNSDWQFTNPVEGSFFRFKHDGAPSGNLYSVAQAEIAADDSTSIYGGEIVTVDRSLSDVIRLPKPGCFVDRRIAIRKIPNPPTLESELKRLFVPGIFKANPSQGQILAVPDWKVIIEASDFVEASTGSGGASGGASGGTTRPTSLNPLTYTVSELETYTYYQDYLLSRINDDNTTAGVMKTSGGTSGQLKLLVIFDTAKIINQITIYPGQFNGNFNSPTRLSVFSGSGESNALLTNEPIDITKPNEISTLNNSAFNTSYTQYIFVFSGSGSDNISINELDLFGA